MRCRVTVWFTLSLHLGTAIRIWEDQGKRQKRLKKEAAEVAFEVAKDARFQDADDTGRAAYDDFISGRARTTWKSQLAFKSVIFLTSALGASSLFLLCDRNSKQKQDLEDEKGKEAGCQSNGDGGLAQKEPNEAPLTYRPEIDGMRAIAVMGVVFFHFDVQYWKGGFVGVDVFYVISGFLITRIVFSDLSQNKPLYGFWARRARRLFPALAVCLSAALIAGAVLMESRRYQSLLEQVRVVLLWVANFRFYLSLDYYFNPLEAPLLNMWSLAVEEQFYMVYPGLAWLMWKLPYKKTLIFIVLIVSFCASVAVAVAYSATHRRFSYYMTPPRVFELALGCMLAFDTGASPFANRMVAEVASWCGLSMIGVAYYTYEISMSYPSYVGLLPCFGGALIIAANRHSLTFAGQVLSFSPLTFIGKISYSWYLWHWPVRVYLPYYYLQQTLPRYGPMDSYHKLFGIVLSFVISVLSYFLVESPCRSEKDMPRGVFWSLSACVWSVLFLYSLYSFWMVVPSTGAYPSFKL